MDLFNMTKTELLIRLKMAEELYYSYKDVEPQCQNCRYWHAGLAQCTPWGEVPKEVQKEGCPEWRYDGIPF